MDRRRFAGSAAAAILLAMRVARAQQPQGKVYRVGYPNLRAGPAAPDEAFVQGMRELGYVVGRNLIIEYRWAGNDMARFQAQVEELVRLNVDVIVTVATPGVREAMRATRTIPIVMAAAADPVRTGLVASLVHPGGNVTGLSILQQELAQKRLQLASELVPGTTRVAVLGWVLAAGASPPGQGPTQMLLAETQAAGRQIGIDVLGIEVAGADELPRAFADMKRERVRMLIVQSSPLTFEHRATILELAARERLPAMYEVRNFVDAGGLVSYGPNLQDLYRRAATYVDKILKGARAGDLPVEQPTKFEFVINLKTARALGLTIPQSLLLRAEEVIQ